MKLNLFPNFIRNIKLIKRNIGKGLLKLRGNFINSFSYLVSF